METTEATRGIAQPSGSVPLRGRERALRRARGSLSPPRATPRLPLLTLPLTGGPARSTWPTSRSAVLWTARPGPGQRLRDW